MTLNPDYLTSISHATKRGQATVYTNKSPEYPDSGNGSASNSGNNSVNGSFNAANATRSYANDLKLYGGGTDSLGNSLNNNNNNNNLNNGYPGGKYNNGGVQKGLRSPSQTAPARLGMWEDERGHDRFLQVISVELFTLLAYYLN